MLVNRLYKLLIDRNISKQRFSLDVEIDLDSLIANNCNIDDSKLIEIADYLDCSKDYLTGASPFEKHGVKYQGYSYRNELNDQSIKFDNGKPKLSFVPYQICNDIAQIREHGVEKYKTIDGWKNVSLDRYIDALLRHIHAFAEDNTGLDNDSGIEHYKHAACNLAFICELMKK